MKKGLKKALCVFLVLTLLTLDCLVYCVSTNLAYSSVFYYELKDDFWGTAFVDYPIWEFYFSKTPSWYIPNNETRSLNFGGELIHCKYLGKVRVSNGNETFYFKIIDELSPSYYEGDVIGITSTMNRNKQKLFYSEMTYLFAQNGVKFEFGKEYIVAYQSLWGNLFFSNYFYAPLDEEYPYIDVYPGATRYDATYFGKDTPYVSKDVFLKCVKDLCQSTVSNHTV